MRSCAPLRFCLQRALHILAVVTAMHGLLAVMAEETGPRPLPVPLERARAFANLCQVNNPAVVSSFSRCDPDTDSSLRREVAGDVQDQLRQSKGVGVD